MQKYSPDLINPTPAQKRRIEAQQKRDLILAKEREISIKIPVIDDNAILDAERRWQYLITNRMSPTNTFSVNLKDHLIESIFLQRYYPAIANFGQMSCRKTRQLKKSKTIPYQVVSTFKINDMQLAQYLFPIFTQMNSCPDIDSDTSIIFWFFDMKDQPLQIEYNWTMQELTVSFNYRVFRRCIIEGIEYLDEL